MEAGSAEMNGDAIPYDEPRTTTNNKNIVR